MTFELPPIPGKEDPRWTRRDGILVRRGEGITKWVVGDTTTVKISAAQTNGALGVLEQAPAWGPETIAALVPELARHQVTLLPEGDF